MSGQISKHFTRWMLGLIATIQLSVADSWMIRETEDGIRRYRAVATHENESVVVGDGGVILSTNDGVIWSPESGSGRNLKDIVWADDQFVAVGSGGTVARFLRTEFQYGQRTSSSIAGVSTLNGIAFSGSKFVVVGNDGKIYRTSGKSPTGWQSSSSGTTKHLNGVAWTGSYWIVVGDEGTILRSSNGSSWTTMMSSTTDDLEKIAVGSDGVVAVGERGVVVTSTKTGFTWTRRKYSTLYNWWDVVWDGTRFQASADLGRIYASVDGVSWSLEPGGVGVDLYGISADEGKLLAVGDDVVVSVNSDGEWQRATGAPVPGGPIELINGEFVMSCFGGTVAFSKDGRVWREFRVQRTPSNLYYNYGGSLKHGRGLVWTGSRFLAAGPDYLYASSDGETWVETSENSGLNQYRTLVWNGSMALAVGSNGFLQSSEDGLSWTTRETGENEEDFFDVVWTGSRWLAVGVYGVYSSDDGVEWTEQYRTHPTYIRALVWTGSEALLATSANGIVRSVDGVAWAPASLDEGSFPDLGSIHVRGQVLHAFAYGLGDRLLRSENGGLQWTEVPFVHEADLGSDPTTSDQIVRLGEDYWGFNDQRATYMGAGNPRSRTINDMHWNGETCIAVGSQGTIRRSQDGRIWRWSAVTFSNELKGVASSDDTWVTVGAGGFIAISMDTVNWEPVESGTTLNLLGVEWTGFGFVAVGQSGTLLTSSDGRTWTKRNTFVTQDLYTVGWNGSQAVVLGSTGVAFSSEDGESWRFRLTPNTAFHRWVVWTGTEFLAEEMRSVDGVTWEALDETYVSGQSAVWNGNELVLAGGTSIWRSKDGRSWSGDLSGSTRLMFAVEWMGDRFVAAGHAGVIVSSGLISSWAEAEGIPFWLAGDDQDANGDGIPNVVAFGVGAPGMGALSAEDRERLPHLVWSDIEARWELWFTRHEPIPDGLSYQVEQSRNGSDWDVLGTRSADQLWSAELGVGEYGNYFGPERTVRFPLDTSDTSSMWRVRIER